MPEPFIDWTPDGQMFQFSERRVSGANPVTTNVVFCKLVVLTLRVFVGGRKSLRCSLL